MSKGRFPGALAAGVLIAFFCLFTGFELLHPVADLLRQKASGPAAPASEASPAESHGPFLGTAAPSLRPPRRVGRSDVAIPPLPEGAPPDPAAPVPILRRLPV